MCCLNAGPQHAGISTSQCQLGHTPRDPLGIHKLTTMQADGQRELFLKRMRCRICLRAAVQEAIVQERIDRINTSRAR